MFLSKIWFFLIALVAAITLTIALVMPRPAQRKHLVDEHNRLAVACGVVDVLLSDEARNRIDLAGKFSRDASVVGAIDAAGGVEKLDDARMKTARGVAEQLLGPLKTRAPDFAMLIDRRGRVVARYKLDSEDYGDTVAGRPIIDDALAGYLRDDVWVQSNTLYFVSASPVIKPGPPVAYVGAVVLGHKMTNEFAQQLVSTLDVELGFYIGEETAAGSKGLALDQSKLLKSLATLKSPDRSTDCRDNAPIDVRASKQDYTAVVARLPGEASLKQAYYTVLIKKPEAVGFSGTLKVVSKSDLSFGNFPWLLVGGAFVIALGVGIALMWVEADRPLRRLAADAVRLAKGDKERLGEDDHGGKFGSIARSVNIAIDKLGREAKSARTNLDSLLGPAPEGSLGTIDLLAGALPSASMPAARPGGPAPAATPPPSDFRFSDPGKAIPTPPPNTMKPPMPKPPIPTPVGKQPSSPVATPPPMPAAGSGPARAPISLDDDILGSANLEPQTNAVDPYFKTVYDQFVAVKQSCGESTTGLTYQKFSEKLVRNREELMQKTGCREVRFTVYVKDGKAALKATPVKEEA